MAASFILDKAEDSSAACRGVCQERISKGQLRLGTVSVHGDTPISYRHFPECMTSNTAHTVLDSVDKHVNDIKGFDELSVKDKATVRKYFNSEEEKIAHLVEEIKNEKHDQEPDDQQASAGTHPPTGDEGTFMFKYVDEHQQACRGPCKGTIKHGDLSLGHGFHRQRGDANVISWRHFPNCMTSRIYHDIHAIFKDDDPSRITGFQDLRTPDKNKVREYFKHELEQEMHPPVEHSPYTIGYASSNRAMCKGPCKEPIEKGHLRIGSIYERGGFSGINWRHFPECMTLREVHHILSAIGEASKMKGFLTLKRGDQDVVREYFAKEARLKYPQGGRGGRAKQNTAAEEERNEDTEEVQSSSNAYRSKRVRASPKSEFQAKS
jgi:hypothetical protein